MSQHPRVVITGLGAVTPLGLDVASTWQGLLEGRSGIGPITRFDATEIPVKIAGEVKGFDASEVIGGKEVLRMDPCQQYGVAAADQALAQAGLGKDHPGAVDPERFGCYVGSGIGGIHTWDANTRSLIDKGPRRVSPFMVPAMISNLVPGNIAIRHDAKGPNFAHSSACATATTSIGEAFVALRAGLADVMVAGGAEAAVEPLPICGFARMKALSTSNDRGASASRPFDQTRDGFVIAEGAAVVVLETLEHAQARGAEILAELVGYASTCDAHHQTAPPPDAAGIRRAIQLCLAQAEISAADVGYVNAHGTSTPFNDKTETIALHAAFGEHAPNLAISSTKSMTGHMLGASGGVEAIACIEGLRAQRVHPTAHLETPDPECDLDYVPGQARDLSHTHAISNSMGFGGQNAALLFRRWDG